MCFQTTTDAADANQRIRMIDGVRRAATRMDYMDTIFADGNCPDRTGLSQGDWLMMTLWYTEMQALFFWVQNWEGVSMGFPRYMKQSLIF